MSVYRTKRSKMWYIALMKDRKRVQFSSGTDDFNEAKAIELAFKDRMGGGRREKFIALMDAHLSSGEEGLRGKRHMLRHLPATVAELMATEKTQLAEHSKRMRVNTCHRLAQWCGEHAGDCVFIDDITPDIAWRFISSMDIKAKTKQNLSCFLSSSWGLLIRRGLARENPWRYAHPDTDPAEQRSGRAFTPEEMGRILEAAKAWPWLETAIVIAVYTGLRKGDVFSLRWESVDFARGVIDMTPSKTARYKRRVIVPLHPTLAKHLRSLPRDGGEVIGRNPSSNWTEWKRCLERAGVRPNGNELMTFHNLRHTFATWVRRAGADKGEQMLLGGWTTLEVSNRYDHAIEPLKEVIGRMPSL